MTSHATPPGPEESRPSTYRRTRRKIGRWRRKLADPDNLTQRQRKMQARLDQQAKQVAEVASLAGQTKSTVAELRSSFASFAKRFRTVELATIHREREHGNLTIQVGICEERLGRIEEQLGEEHLSTNPDEEAEARSLLAEVRREHEQVRVRMQVIGQYEERLRRLEAAVVNCHGDDVRHPI